MHAIKTIIKNQIPEWKKWAICSVHLKTFYLQWIMSSLTCNTNVHACLQEGHAYLNTGCNLQRPVFHFWKWNLLIFSLFKVCRMIASAKSIQCRVKIVLYFKIMENPWHFLSCRASIVKFSVNCINCLCSSGCRIWNFDKRGKGLVFPDFQHEDRNSALKVQNWTRTFSSLREVNLQIKDPRGNKAGN